MSISVICVNLKKIGRYHNVFQSFHCVLKSLASGKLTYVLRNYVLSLRELCKFKTRTDVFDIHRWWHFSQTERNLVFFSQQLRLLFVIYSHLWLYRCWELEILDLHPWNNWIMKVSRRGQRERCLDDLFHEWDT